MNDKDLIITGAVSSLTDGFILPEGTVKWARTGPMPDDPKGYEYIPAPDYVREMMHNRFDKWGLTAISPEDPDVILHCVENYWDGPYTVRRYETQIELEYVYVYRNPYNGDTDVFNEFGYFTRNGTFTPWSN